MGDPVPISASAILAVIITIAVMAGLAWCLKKASLSRRSGRAIAIETAVPLGDRRSLVVVAVEGRRLLLGLTPTQVSLVTELDSVASPVSGGPAAKPFDEVLDESTRSHG